MKIVEIIISLFSKDDKVLLGLFRWRNVLSVCIIFDLYPN